MNYKVINGNNIDVLKTYDDNTFDSIVTDPPYGIEFLGKNWDKHTGAMETWHECLRVLKPGGYILAFSAARTYHQLATNIEQAGFEIRDQLMWLYSSGFPKAQDIGKAIDKRIGVEQTTEAQQWAGWKTALKPAHEPIVMARKPFKGSCIDNVLKHGTGALNIDATRVEAEQELINCYKKYPEQKSKDGVYENFNPEVSIKKENKQPIDTTEVQGRYPSNVLGEVEGYSKYFYCPKVSRKERHIGCVDPGVMFSRPRNSEGKPVGESESMVWDPKVNGQSAIKEQPAGTNNHPTVKPVALMEYLIKLVTPPGGHVLDPFNGSGSTGMAAASNDFEYTGIELDPAYADISRRRIQAWIEPDEPDNNFNELFGEV